MTQRLCIQTQLCSAVDPPAASEALGRPLTTSADIGRAERSPDAREGQARGCGREMGWLLHSLRRNALLVMSIGVTLSTPVGAVDWPSAACASTLQACIDGTSAGQVQIVTDAAIAENIEIRRGIMLYKFGTPARFAPGRSISIFAQGGGSQEFTLSNLWVFGRIYVLLGGPTGTMDVVLDGLRVENDLDGAVSIQRNINPTSSADSVRLNASTFITGASSPAISVSGASSTTSFKVNVTSNNIVARNSGIQITMGAGVATLAGNQISQIPPSDAGGSGISIDIANSGGTSAIARNVIVDFPLGVVNHSADAQIVNNTMVRAREAAIFLQSASRGRVANNLISNGRCGISKFSSGAVSLATTDYNFFHALTNNHCDGSAAGINDRVGTPLFTSANDFRVLNAGSPNVNAGNDADQPGAPFLVLPDFDQRNGRVGGRVDIGAFEYSTDRSFEHFSAATNVFFNETSITPPVPLLGTDVLQLSQFGRDIESGNLLFPNASAHLALRWNLTNWRIANESTAGTISPQRRFFVLSNANSSDIKLVHIASMANVVQNYTILSDPNLNGRLGALPIVTQRLSPFGGNGIYNNSAIGIFYDESISRWVIFNQKPTGSAAPAMPIGAAFNVTIPVGNFGNVFAFRTRGSAAAAAAATISHPFLNSISCAHPYVTLFNAPTLVNVPANIVVSYRSAGDGRGNWIAERGDGLPIPAGAGFHVYIDVQQSRRCNSELLVDGFE